MPTISQADLDFLNNTVYPAVFNGTYGYTDDVMRQAFTSADIGFLCNVYALAKYTKNAYVYEFDIFPAVHGEDVAYTFYNGPASLTTAKKRAGKIQSMKGNRKRQLGAALSTYDLAAVTLQDWIVSFTMTGKPSSSLSPAFSTYGTNQTILKIVSDQSSALLTTDDIYVTRCKAWIERVFPDLG